MFILQAVGLTKAYGIQSVFDGVTFSLDQGERAGLVGPNGCGKSTLLRCLVGLEQPDAGRVIVAPETRIGYLPQFLPLTAERTVGEILSDAQHDLVDAEQSLSLAGEAIAAGEPGADDAYDAALVRFEALGGYERQYRAEQVLDGLGLSEVDPALPGSTLSGGQKTRLGLASLLLTDPNLLLLDEPTNHLDVDALRWLEEFVDGFPGAVLAVSHDRTFLDRTVTRILYLDPKQQTVRSYPGNYTAFREARLDEAEATAERWKRQEEYVERVSADIARLKGEALAIERSTTPRQPGVRKFARRKAQVAKSREKKLERFLGAGERVEKPSLSWGLKLDFGEPPAGGQDVMRLDDVSFAYPCRPPLFQALNLSLRYGDRLALVGPNGAGKSTLLKLMEGRLAPTTGNVRRGAGVRLGMLAQEGEMLDLDATVLATVLRERAMSETDARSFLHFFLFGGDSVFRKVGDCSLGERSRLQLARLVLQGSNLLLLDEPLNHLDIEGREHFLAALEAFAGTIVAVTHDRAFLEEFADRVLEVRDGDARVYEAGLW